MEINPLCTGMNDLEALEFGPINKSDCCTIHLRLHHLKVMLQRMHFCPFSISICTLKCTVKKQKKCFFSKLSHHSSLYSCCITRARSVFVASHAQQLKEVSNGGSFPFLPISQGLFKLQSRNRFRWKACNPSFPTKQNTFCGTITSEDISSHISLIFSHQSLKQVSSCITRARSVVVASHAQQLKVGRNGALFVVLDNAIWLKVEWRWP